MKIVLRSASATRICDWESFALLRDKVQHFLERGEPTERFRALHAIERVVDVGEGAVDAPRLRGEVMRAWCALWKVELENAAISVRTRAVQTRVDKLPDVRGTLSARVAGWPLPVRGSQHDPVPRAAARFIQAVFDVTKTAADGDLLQVRCVGIRKARHAPTCADEDRARQRAAGET